MLFYVIWSVKIKLTSKTGEEGLLPIGFFIVLLGIMAMTETFYSKKGWELFYVIIALIYLAGYFVYNFMIQYLHFMKTNEGSAANIPEQEIFYSGMKQTLVFTFAGTLIMFFTANLGWFSQIMSIIGDWILNLLRALFSGFHYEVVEEGEKMAMEQVMQSLDGIGEVQGPSIFLLILEKMVTIIAVVVVAAVTVAVVIGIYKFLRGHFQLVEKKEKKKLQSNQDIREKCDAKASKKEKTSWFTFLSNREKIRKLYRKRVLQGKAAIIGDIDQIHLECMTAKECCDKLGAENLKKMYEKARYSEEEISNLDVRKAKIFF